MLLVQMLHTGNVCYCPLEINLLCNLCDLSCSYSYRCIYNDDILCSVDKVRKLF